MNDSIQRLCVFCGSKAGANERYAQAARDLGSTLASRSIELVYGGGNIGLMGIVADAALAKGGRVTGVIPKFMVEHEVAHHGVTDLRIVGSMHERKAMMADLSDGFIALPGGFGTLEELSEVLTWGQLKLHHKPVGLLNVAGFFDAFLVFLDQSVEAGFLKPTHRQLLRVDDQIDSLLERLGQSAPSDVDKWMDHKRLDLT